MPRGLWLFILLLILYLTTLGGQFFISDGAAMFATTQSLVEYGSWTVAPNPGLPQVVPGVDGQFYSMYDPGQPLAAVPFYVIGRLLAGLPGGDVYALTTLVVSLLPQIVTALSGFVLYCILKRLFGAENPVLLTTILWATGMLAWPYSKFFFPEAPLTLCLLLAFYALLQADSWRWAALLAGIALGYAFAIRASALIYALPLLGFTVIQGRTGGYRWRLRDYALFVAGLIPFGLLFLWHNQLRFGSPFTSGYQGQGFTTPFSVGLFGLLFSPGRSLFIYVPLLIPALSVCLFRLWRERRGLAVFTLAMLLTPLVFYASWWTWHGGWSWGPRFLVPALPFLMLPIGFVLSRTVIPRPLLALILVGWLAGVLVNITGVTVDFNPYFAAVTQGDYSREALIWYDLAHSPIIAHWRALLRGESLAWGETALAKYGIPSTSAALYVPVMLALLVGWIVVLGRGIMRFPNNAHKQQPREGQADSGG